YGVEVAGEVQVDVLRGLDLGLAPSRTAALDPEHGPERGLPQAERRPHTQPPEAVGEPDADRRLALPGARRRDRADEHEASPGGAVPLAQGARAQLHLRLVTAVGHEPPRVEAEFRGDVLHGSERWGHGDG